MNVIVNFPRKYDLKVGYGLPFTSALLSLANKIKL